MPFTIHHSPITGGLVRGALMVGVAAFVVGCGTDTNDSTVPTPTVQRGQETRDPVAQRGTDSSRDLHEYTFEQKEEFTDAMEDRIDNLNREIDQLAESVDASNEAMQARTRPRLEALRAESAELSRQLDQAENAEASTWSQTKAGISRSYTATRDGLRSARQWTSDAIAP